jgi:hypothetical protein
VPAVPVVGGGGVVPPAPVVPAVPVSGGVGGVVPPVPVVPAVPVVGGLVVVPPFPVVAGAVPPVPALPVAPGFGFECVSSLLQPTPATTNENSAAIAATFCEVMSVGTNGD